MSSFYDGPIIDAHHHLWELDSGRYAWLTDGPREVVFGSTAPLIRDYFLADYLADMAGIGLVKSVHIPGELPRGPGGRGPAGCRASRTKTAFPTASSPTPCWRSRMPRRLLEAHRAHPNMRGIRQILSWHENPAWTFHERSDLMQDAAWRRGFGLLQKFDLSFDMMIYSGQLGDALDLARTFPDTQIILKPHRQSRRPGRRGHRRLARGHERAGRRTPTSRSRSPTSAPTTTNWTTESTRPFIHHTIDAFGTERCMFASDFPVAALHGGADAIYDSFKTIVADLSRSDEQRALFHDNAVRFYRLGD